MTNKIVLLSTCGSAEEAGRVARALVESKAAACVNIVPGIQSVYEWKGSIEQAPEWLLVIKTKRSLLETAIAVIRRVHSYEVPEAVAIAIENGLPEYLGWMDSVLQSTPEA
jgi:periplasmic divalent cation tolerance protein